jgi:hypothetical protein
MATKIKKIEELVYTTEGNSDRGEVQHYHRKPHPRELQIGAKHTDVSQLKPNQKQNLIKFANGDYSSKFTIGFEVEKNQLSRGAVKEYPLFCGFERDGSCGYEAVTNILPLLPSGKWRNKVFNMMVEGKKIIEDAYSPSDKRCGGHCTIAVEGMDGIEIMDKVRKNCGVLWALFRHRLNNSYCSHNQRLLSDYDHRCDGSRYHTALIKGNCLEFRVVARFQSVKQMMRRYELFYELVDFSINKPNGKFKDFLKIVKPIILSMYEGDVAKTEEILKLSVKMQDYINDGTNCDEIREFVRGW